MTTYFDIFNIKTDMQLNNIMNNLDLSANEMFQLDDIVNDFSSLKEKREKILEMFSGTNNYNYCCKLFLKEDMETPSQLNMNQTIELNELFALASEKFKKVNCSQQFYQMLSQKTSKNFANAFFNMLKSIPEDSNCRFDPNLEIDGKNFAETIYPYVNELTTFLNGCKSESKKEEVKENYEIGNKVQGKGKNQGTYIIDSIKDGFYNLKHIYSNDKNKLYPVSKKTLDEEFKLIKESIEKEISFDDIKEFAEKYDLIPTNKNEKANNRTYAKFITYPKSMNFNTFKKDALKKFGNNIEVIKGKKLKNNRFIVGIWYNGIDNLNESIETQPDMFGGPDTYYKDGIEALDFDNVLDAMNKIAPEMDFVDDRDVKGKYSMIFQPKSSGLELNQNGYKKIKKFMEEKFGKENISVKLAHSQYAPEIKKLYVTFINQIDVQDELNESLDDTLNNFKYFITSSSDKNELNVMKDKLEILFNGSNDTELRNTISELLSMINSKLNTIKPSIDECCELGNLLEPFKTTVVNITVNDEGCLEDVEKESATNNLKALASHINDKKDCCEENNIENMQTIMSLISSLASFFQKRLCESQDLDNNIIYDPNKELEDIKERYINKELDYYDAIKEVENIIGNEKISEEKVESWDDSSKHGLYGITDNGKMEDAIESVNAQIDDFGSYDDEYVRSICDDVAKENGVDVKKLYYYVTNHKWSAWDNEEDYEELDEDFIHDLYNPRQRKKSENWGNTSKANRDFQKWSYHNAKGMPKYSNNIREELNDIKQDYLNNELDVYDATNAVDNLIGNKSKAEAIVDSWDDPSKHGLYGITDDEELDEDTVYDHSWYEVEGQKYPKRTKNGVEIKEGIKDWFKKDNRKYRIEYGTHGGWISKDKKHIVGDLTDTLIVTGLKKAERLAKYFDNGAEPRMFHPDEIKQTDKGWNFKYTQEFLDILEKVKNGEMSEEEAKNYFEKNGLPVHQYWIYLKLALPNKKKINEMCSGGATCTASVGTIPSPTKPKSPKKKHKKSKVDEMALNMFKRHIIEDVNSQIDANGNHYEYRDGYFYINGDIARTKSKYQMLESLDENIELETLPGFNSEEMRLLEDIEASGSVGNEDDNNQNNNSSNNNNADNNNNQQNTNQNINQDNLGDVEQNVTQDNDLTPQQRQLKKDTEQVLDQSMNSGSDTEVSVNQGLDNNNDTTNNSTPNTNNVKYKVIGKDDSDSNNIKYIIQDPNSKETMVVDATKLRLEK